MKPLSLQRFVLVFILVVLMAVTLQWWAPVLTALPSWVLPVVGAVLAVAVAVQYVRTGRF